ncbi:MAG: 23S rRNA (adenine(2030)-N(6))-methyltransferase RlmJ [Gemmobacter sp.]|nr:23S rRNA (adenine(2030)-N(6))-methyltransferase RlmJ [Gemmobacter sp.]
MLSYQHAYHAGNAADVQKHALLAWMIAAMADKPKAMTYIETHAGRGLYALDAPEAVKTGEAAGGVERLAARFAPDHPYRRCLDAVRAAHGPSAYPGSPVIAGLLLRVFDRIVLAELHPREHAALSEAMAPFEAEERHEDGFAMARAVCPPTPRRGLLVIDPSYEVKEDYARLPGLIAELARKWPVGVIVLWYPLLTGAAHGPMLAALERAHPGALRHEVRFPPVREGHRMVGSGLFVINPPWRLDEEAARISALFDA